MLGTGLAAVLMRQTRNAMIEVLSADYIRTARAKGLAPAAVVVRHALRNSLIPVVTILGLQMGALMSGAVVTEQIFVVPGFGRLIVEARVHARLPARPGRGADHRQRVRADQPAGRRVVLGAQPAHPDRRRRRQRLTVATSAADVVARGAAARRATPRRPRLG